MILWHWSKRVCHKAKSQSGFIHKESFGDEVFSFGAICIARWVPAWSTEICLSSSKICLYSRSFSVSAAKAGIFKTIQNTLLFLIDLTIYVNGYGGYDTTASLYCFGKWLLVSPTFYCTMLWAHMKSTSGPFKRRISEWYWGLCSCYENTDL